MPGITSNLAQPVSACCPILDMLKIINAVNRAAALGDLGKVIGQFLFLDDETGLNQPKVANLCCNQSFSVHAR
jgi:hypothetical protein